MPDANDELAEPVVWAIFASRIEVLPNSQLKDLKNATEITARGMAVLIVKPTRKPRYAFALPKSTPKTAPTRRAFILKSLISAVAGI